MVKTTMAVSVNSLEKSFKDLKVLKKIDFRVEKGSIFALLGPNGAGKTTTIKILSTLLKPDKGNARVSGFDVIKQSEQVRGEISLTGQYAAVDEILTGRENLQMIGKLRHLSDVKKKSDELLERFDLLEAADRTVANYSGGMRRRLDLAMSLLGSPSVIFLDEPTTGLDPKSRLAMWEIIKNLKDSGITVFLTTQYLDEADKLADQIAILKDGKIVAEGTAAELKKMLPEGHIELGFPDEDELHLAGDLLGEYKIILDKDKRTLTIATDGSIKQLTEILKQLETARVDITEFTQKPPTLEDVFLTVVNKKERK